MATPGRLALSVERIKEDLGLDPAHRAKAAVAAALADLDIAGGATLRESVVLVLAELGVPSEGWPGGAAQAAATAIQRRARGRRARTTLYPAARRRESARRHIVQELRTTEQTYNAALGTLIASAAQLVADAEMPGGGDDAARQSRAWLAKSHGGGGTGATVEGMPSAADIAKVFSNVAELKPISDKLLRELDARVGEGGANWRPGGTVCDVLLRLAPQLDKYRSYSSRYADSTAHLDKCRKTFPQLDSQLVPTPGNMYT